MPNARVVQREKPTQTGFAPAIPTPLAVADGLASTSLSASSVEKLVVGVSNPHTSRPAEPDTSSQRLPGAKAHSPAKVVARGIEPTHTESCDSTLPSGTSTTKGAGRGERGYFRRQIYNPDFHNPAKRKCVGVVIPTIPYLTTSIFANPPMKIIPKFMNFWKNLRKIHKIL